MAGRIGGLTLLLSLLPLASAFLPPPLPLPSRTFSPSLPALAAASRRPTSAIGGVWMAGDSKKRAKAALKANESREKARRDGGLLGALYKFTRPHTIRGTILASCACVTRVTLMSIRTQSFIEWSLLRTAALGLIALLCGNAYIVGINQIYDVDIDKVNKPFLPVASGDISPSFAWLLVAGSGIGGLSLVYAFFPPLIKQLYTFGMLLGTVYTVPPFRWKNNALLAMLNIACVRGLLLNVGLHHASSHALSLPLTWPPQVIFISMFMTIFAIVIAICKDMPDTKGDIEFNVSTLPATIGVDKTAQLAVFTLFVNYMLGISFGIWAKGVNSLFMICSHGALALWLLTFSSKLKSDSVPSIKLFYRNIWKLFYTEYLLFPFI